MTHLDPRPARCDMTSRECCKLLTATLTAMLVFCPAEQARQLFRISAAPVIESDPPKDWPSDYGPASAPLAALLSALLSALAEQAAPGALRTACDWILEHDDAWALMQDYASIIKKGQNP